MPPIRPACLVGFLLLISAGVAAQSPGDREPSAPAREVTETIEEPGDSLALGRGFAAPSWVMARSFLIPGWGQAKNGAWWKALFCAGVGAAFYERLYFEDRMVTEYRDKMQGSADPHQTSILSRKVERHRGHRRDFIWWTALFLALCGGDAYVDAHLRNFDVRLQVEPEIVVPSEAAAANGNANVGWGLRAGISWMR